MDIKKLGSAIEAETFLEKPRAYFGVSAMGEPCKRQLWYDFRQFTKPEPITAREQRLFTRGHYEELVLYADIIRITKSEIEYIEIGEAVKKVFSTVFNINLDADSKQRKLSFCSGHGSGHSDGVLMLLKKGRSNPYLLECKTSNTKGFKDLQRDLNLQRSKPVHYDQIQGYLHLMKLKKCLYCMVCKETDERIFLIIKYDKDYATDLFITAEKIILRPIPPARINEDSEYYRCRPYICKITGDEKLFCPHRQVCHFNARPQKTCRSCWLVEIHDKGKWYCTKKKKCRSFKQQLSACKKYASFKIEG